jgi:hypothetical protein
MKCYSDSALVAKPKDLLLCCVPGSERRLNFPAFTFSISPLRPDYFLRAISISKFPGPSNLNRIPGGTNVVALYSVTTAGPR